MFYIFIITIVTGIDQWTKYLVETQLKPIGAIPIVKPELFTNPDSS